MDIRPLITARAEITPIETKADAANRPEHIREHMARDPIARIPDGDKRIAASNGEMFAVWIELETETSARVGVQSM